MDFPYQTDTSRATTNLIDPISKIAIWEQNQNDSFIEQVLKIFGFNVGELSWASKPVTIFAYIQAIANFALWLLAFISVCILIYNFILIFFDKEKEGIDNAKKTVKRVLYSLVLIGSSRIIVSFLFFILKTVVK